MGWISVKDKLPDDTLGEYITCLKNNSVTILNFSTLRTYNWFSPYHKDDWQEKNPVTHWMPFPKPPKTV